MTSKQVIVLIVGLVLLLGSAPGISGEGETPPAAGDVEVVKGGDAQPKTTPGAPDEALVQLKPEQLHSLLEDRMMLDAGRPRPAESLDMVAILVPLSTFMFLFFSVLVVLVYRGRKNKTVHETLRLMVEKGAQIPHELLVPPVRKNADLRAGVLLITGGLGFVLFMGLIALFEPDALKGAGVGLVPIFIGIGYLIVWKLNRKSGKPE